MTINFGGIQGNLVGSLAVGSLQVLLGMPVGLLDMAEEGHSIAEGRLDVLVMAEHNTGGLEPVVRRDWLDVLVVVAHTVQCLTGG